MAVGGVRVTEPGADLAVCLAVASAMSGRPAPAGTVVCGEVGLGGELRRVGRMEHRLSEAARMGFTTAVVPMSSPARFEGIEVQRVPNLQAAVALLDLGT
jgi:DNA repair protein RadA/Sms